MFFFKSKASFIFCPSLSLSVLFPFSAFSFPTLQTGKRTRIKKKEPALEMVQMESSSAAKRLWHIVRVVFYMLGKNKFMMDLHLLLKRGKIAGKALTNLLTFHHHHHHHHHHRHHHHRLHHHTHAAATMYSALTCRSMDPNRSFYTPKEVEFSCSNTPSSFHLIKRKHHRRHDYDFDYDADTVAKVFEILNSEASEAESLGAESPSPAPAINWRFGKSPAAARQLRITDSPFLVKEEEEDGEVEDCHIDEDAEEFIKKFYEQLRLQQRNVPVTPEYNKHYHRREPLMGRA